MNPQEALMIGQRWLRGEAICKTNTEVIDEQSSRLGRVDARVHALASRFKDVDHSGPARTRSLLLPFVRATMHGDTNLTEIAILARSFHLHSGVVGHTELEYYRVILPGDELTGAQRSEAVTLRTVFGTEVSAVRLGGELSPPRDNLNDLSSIKVLDEMEAALAQVDRELSDMPQLAGTIE